MIRLDHLTWVYKYRMGVYAKIIDFDIRQRVISAVESEVDRRGVVTVLSSVKHSTVTVWQYLVKKEELRRYHSHSLGGELLNVRP